jgi:hypothetical protein
VRMENKLFNCAEAREIDLVNYLFTLGFHPLKIRGNDYWYLSPLREEREASFKVNRKLNVWYDHGIGEGGDIIEFWSFVSSLDYWRISKKVKPTPSSFSPASSAYTRVNLCR